MDDEYQDEIYQVELHCECMSMLDPSRERLESSIAYHRLWVTGEFEVLTPEVAEKLQKLHVCNKLVGAAEELIREATG